MGDSGPSREEERYQVAVKSGIVAPPRVKQKVVPFISLASTADRNVASFSRILSTAFEIVAWIRDCPFRSSFGF